MHRDMHDYTCASDWILSPSRSRTMSSTRRASRRMVTSLAPPSFLISMSMRCAGGGRADVGGGREGVTRPPRRGGESAVMNSDGTGSLTCASRNAGRESCKPYIASGSKSPCLATSSRRPSPPISKITRPIGALTVSFSTWIYDYAAQTSLRRAYKLGRRRRPT